MRVWGRCDDVRYVYSVAPFSSLMTDHNHGEAGSHHPKMHQKGFFFLNCKKLSGSHQVIIGVTELS